MARKPEEPLRVIEGLPQDSLKQVKEFIDSLEGIQEQKASRRPERGATGKRQLCAIKKWAGRSLKAGFSGREHDALLYGTLRLMQKIA